METEALRALAEKFLGEKRYAHTLAVARLARELALRHGADPQAAYQAGLLHDLMKERTVPELLQKIESSGILIDKEETPEQMNPGALHALAGFCFARDELFITDEDVLNAVRYHTTGRAGMSLLEKVVFAADKYAYDRTYAGVESYRAMAFAGLDESLLAFLEYRIPRHIKLRELLSLDSIRMYNALCAAREERDG